MRARSLAVLTFVSAGTACGPYCRPIEVRPLAVECENLDIGQFQGELHFDSAPPFETFLSQQCMPNAAEDRLAQIVESVDFTREGVFVVAGRNNLDSTRCVETRELDDAEVCTNGLRVYFEDSYRSVDRGCPSGVWTVAFALSRADLAAALEAGERGEAL